MSKALATTAPIKPPKELQSFLDNPPLVGNELFEEYEAVFMAIANALKPTDFIVWQCAERLTDLAWYIRRERILKNEIIKLYHKEIVSELLAGMFNNPMLGVSEDARRWEWDPKARLEIDQRLTKLGHSQNSVLAQACIRGADQIAESDRRAAAYEARSIVILRDANLYSEKLARQIDQASSDVVEGEFNEAAE
jgi:hypothetical protein